jgi:hypothetical protein
MGSETILISGESSVRIAKPNPVFSADLEIRTENYSQSLVSADLYTLKSGGTIYRQITDRGP